MVRKARQYVRRQDAAAAGELGVSAVLLRQAATRHLPKVAMRLVRHASFEGQTDERQKRLLEWVRTEQPRRGRRESAVVEEDVRGQSVDQPALLPRAVVEGGLRRPLPPLQSAVLVSVRCCIS